MQDIPDIDKKITSFKCVNVNVHSVNSRNRMIASK